MKVLLVGGSGFLGRHLREQLRARGAETVVTSRSLDRGDFVWDPSGGPIYLSALHDVDAVVNLAGEPLTGLWTRAKRKRAYDSRVVTTRNLVAGIVESPHRPRILVNASAAGYYGDRGDEPLPESSTPGTDFLCRMCADWEEEARKVEARDVACARVRLGVVLARREGGYPLMSLPFRWFLGGRIGSGRQYLPWIHVDDAAGIVLHCLEHPDASGAFNAAAPEAVTNRQWTKTLASVLHRPAFFPVPGFVLRAVAGGIGRLATFSERVVPEHTLQSGYSFQWPSLRPALENIEYGWSAG